MALASDPTESRQESLRVFGFPYCHFVVVVVVVVVAAAVAAVAAVVVDDVFISDGGYFRCRIRHAVATPLARQNINI